MSAPDSEREALGPLKYELGPAQVLPPSGAAGARTEARRRRAPAASDSHMEAPGTPDARLREPPWKRRNAPMPFEGDVAIWELRTRLTSAPDLSPEPVLSRARGAGLTWVGRLTWIVVLAAGGALTLLWLSPRHGDAPGHSVDLISYEQPPSPDLQVAAASAKSDLARAPQSTMPLPRAADLLLRPTTENERHPGRDLTTGTASPAAGPDHVDLPPATEMQDAARPSETRMTPPAATVHSFGEAIPDRNAIAALVARGRKYLVAGDVAAARLAAAGCSCRRFRGSAQSRRNLRPGGIEAARRHWLIGRPGAGTRLVSQGRGVRLRRRAPTAGAAC